MFFSFSGSRKTGERTHILDLDIGERIDELDLEVGERVHELPLPDLVGKRLDDLHLEIGERGDDLHLDVGEGVDDLYLAGETDSLVIPVGIDFRGGRCRGDGQRKQQENEQAEFLFHGDALPFEKF